MGSDFVLVLVVITTLPLDLPNGFHDPGNAMATSIATGALPPRVAVALSGVLNLAGAFLSLSVAATIPSGLVEYGHRDSDRGLRGVGRRHHLEPDDLVPRDPVELLARPDRRRRRVRDRDRR